MPSRLNFVTEEEIASAHSLTNEGGYWKSYKGRWKYHKATIDIISKNFRTSAPEKILEIGTMGVQTVKGSNTMDFAEKFNFKNKEQLTTVMHDARQIPWPLADKSYDCIVALRVFHHLHPVQCYCFREARRIGKSIVIVAPIEVANTSTKAISIQEWIDFNNGIPPRLIQGMGGKSSNYLLYWDKESLERGANNMI